MIERQNDKRQPTLQTLLDKKKLTQRQLSQQTGLTERTIQSVVRGSTLPRLDRALVIAEALGISLEELCVQLGLKVGRDQDHKSNN